MSDLELITHYKQTHNAEYVGELYVRYTHLVFGACFKYLKNREESEDAVTRIFEKLLEDLKQFEVHNFKAWLFQVSRNFCLMELRKRQSVDQKNDLFQKELVADMESDSFSHLNDEDDMAKWLKKLPLALDELGPEQKQCVELFYIQEKSYQEIVDETGFSLKQVKSFLQNGRRNLKIQLSKLVSVLLTLFIG
ncbi:sigma-70 family RNA polymerase sigma factor [Flammeovirgaceae bacterium SG7u.111]|nr:sigma-70 family RNA polymerase sigma factor [Flammeovirgaceae bacterium SG7u.132]WPO36310.1 sigma-70 family RNA polymerase sigma factor [Flammeovirgaceae bacterium SG7u.111]